MFGLGVPECTSFGLLPSVTANAHTFIGQNWDWTPEAGESLIILVVKQEPLPTVVLLTEAGMIGRLGFNSAGIGLMTNTLITDQRQMGVPYNIVLRGILNGWTMGDSIGAVLRAERAIAANYLIAASGGEAIDLEAAPDTLDYLYPQDTPSRMIFHTYLHLAWQESMMTAPSCRQARRCRWQSADA
jgi:isopenicillin-N N-acyltransferase-like protein